MSKKKILAVILALVMVLSFAACGGKTEEPAAPDEETTEAVAETEAVVEDEETLTEAPEEVTEEAAEAAEEATEAPAAQEEEETEAPAEETTEEAKKVPETKEEIVEFYKAAAAASDKAGVKTSNVMKLESLEGGSGGVGAFVNLLEPIVRNTLEKNSSTDNHITGGYQNLTADDVASATATDDGKYTTVTINLKEQTDGMNGKSKEGHVGHGISVLDGMQQAVDQLSGLDVDASGGTLAIRYNNAQIKVKIDNETGKIVSGTWSYKANVTIDNVIGKIGFVKVTLKGASAVISQTITM